MNEQCFCHNCKKNVDVKITSAVQAWEKELKYSFKKTTVALKTPRCSLCERPLFELLAKYQQEVSHEYRPKEETPATPAKK